ncbi:PREDICTED: protein KIAA0100-like [Rhagoletis zephyria]|uniref:protein KIAA0100-like n=1 Tax=Rhagoletis zephyria TaxID=28612 RepID=UPI0008114568|nr:PREDICTED: protein KIAA0100-like [Rhagoletis zephyria]
MNSELSSVEITLYKVDAAAASTGPGAGGGGEREDEAARFFFLKLHKVSYNRETKVPPHVAAAMALEEEEQAPIHRLIVHDLKGAWTKDNRDIVLTLFDSYFKTQLLKRNLSTEALRLFKDQLGGGGGGGGSPSKPGGQFEKNSSPYGSGGGHHQQHSSHHLSKGNAANMLQKLIAEVESESNVADTEQIENGVGSDRPMLYGIEACCQTHDLLLNNWLIELINSQVVLRGCETDGYVIVSAAKTSVTQRIHRPVWKNRVLYSKTTWQGSLECMQYYATVDAGGLRIDDITWLNLDDIEEQGGEEEEEVASGRKNIVENPDTVMGSGRSVGGVVNSEAGGCSTTASSAGNGSLPGINEPPSVVVKVPIQMQRIVSRCRCQFFYASYGENTDPSCYEEVPPLPADDLLPLEPWDKEVAVDTFTLTHEHLEISTNSQQFAMIMDLVNNLLLYVPHKKEVFEKQQRIRFSMQLNSLEDQRGPISELQDKVRLLLTRIKALEKEDYYMRKNHHGGGGSGSSAGVGGGGSTGNSGGTIGGGGGGKKPSSSKLSSMMTASDDPESAKLAASLKETEWELHQCKEELARVGDDLSIMINCYKEAQLIASKTKERQVAAQESRDLLAQVVRRNEVCFKQASWRLTDIDGQLMLCDMVLQNFLYTKVSKNDDSVQHSFELGYVSVKNQMPNQVYREVLQPTELQPNMPVDQHRALRIICIEKAPVGGISVKEHLEVNVIPLTVGLTYAFFMKMLKFFFPERSTSLQEQQQQQQVSSTVTSTTGVGSSSAGNAPSAFGSSTVGSMAGDSGFDSLSGVGADDTISSAGSISTITSVSSSSKGEKAGKKGKGASAAAMKKEESTLSLASSLSSYNFKSSSKSNPTTSFQHIEKMRERASKNQTFVFIKIPEVPIRISYKGNKNKNLEDLRDVNLILPTFEYHNRTWTWLDLLMALKNDSKRVLLSQALKHKFHISKSKPQQLLSSALLSSSSSSSSSASAAAADAEKQQQQQQSALQQGSNSGGSGNGGSQSVVKSSEDEDKVRILLGKIVVPQKTTKSKSLLLFGKK